MTPAEGILRDWEEYFLQKVRRRGQLFESYLRFVHRLIARDLPPIFDVDHLSLLIGLDRTVLARALFDNRSFYRQFEISKRNGGKRIISCPKPTLLMAQKWIYKEILSKLPVHEAAHAYVGGRSILTNVQSHLGASVILKLDLKDFFPSIQVNRGISVFLKSGYPPNVSYYLATLCFLNGSLPQGAPTSPVLSNIISKRLDTRLAALADNYELVYTRYADDLTFSGKKLEPKFLFAVRTIIEAEGLIINQSKTRIICGSGKKIITGISISSGHMKLPRPTVRQVKLEAFHLLKNGVANFSDNLHLSDPLIVERLIGRINFWLQVEPGNLTALSLKYSLIKFQSELAEHLKLQLM